VTRTDFTNEQWQLLRSVPWTVALAVMDADTVHSSEVRSEISAALDEIKSGIEFDGHRSLTQQVAEDLVEHHAREPWPPRPGLTETVALEELRIVNQILDQVASEEEARDFRLWLTHIAERVAEASREGFLGGPSHRRVSVAEMATIDRIRLILGLTDA
jgi:hypothetical protein